MATMWIVVRFAAITTYVRTYAGVVGDEHGDEDGAGTGNDREW